MSSGDLAGQLRTGYTKSLRMLLQNAFGVHLSGIYDLSIASVVKQYDLEVVDSDRF